MGLLRTSFILMAKPTLFVLQAAYLGLWHNRSGKGKLMTAAAAVMGLGVGMHFYDKNHDVPEPRAIQGIDDYRRDLPAPAPRVAPQQPAAENDNGGGFVDVPPAALVPGGDLPDAPAPSVAQAYLEYFYDNKTAQYLDSLPAGERGAAAASIAADRALLLEAITAYETIVVTPADIADRQRAQMERDAAALGKTVEELQRTLIIPSALYEQDARAERFRAQYPQYIVNADQAAELDRRMGLPAGSNARATIIDYLTDSPTARERGLRNYFIDRPTVLERANEGQAIPLRRSSLETAPTTHAALSTYRLGTPRFG